MSIAETLLPGFEHRQIAGAGADIAVRIAGSGPPVLCLHGYPQTMAMWHRVAPELAKSHTVVLADLRGYGESSAPQPWPDHANYAKRAMAADLAAVMTTLGFDRFAVVGHDRGARVGYRLALDHPKRVSTYVSLDVIPTLDIWETLNRDRMLRLYHWAFLAQPAPFPENWISHDPAAWVSGRMARGAGPMPTWLDPRALAHDTACFQIAATCADYRAGASIDIEHDRQDRDSGRKLTCPVTVIWGERGNLVDGPDPIEVWSRWSSQPVNGGAIASGHFMAQEAPDALLAAIQPILAAAPGGI